MGGSNGLNFGAGDFTICYWERPTEENRSYAIARDCTDISPFFIGYRYGLIYMSSDGINWDVCYGKDGGVPPLDEWSFVAVVRSGTVFTSYRNMEQQDAWESSLALHDTANPLEIGRHQDIFFHKGMIDEVMIFNRALDQDELGAVYDLGYGQVGTSAPEAASIRQLRVSTTNVLMGATGIGTNSPAEKLHVVGGARFEDGIRWSKPLGDVGMGAYTNGN